MNAHIEREFKWQARTNQDFEQFLSVLHAICMKVSSKKELKITDCYLDNPQHDFKNKKIALRLRNTNGRYEGTLKTRTALKNGLACREELTFPLLGCSTRKQALQALEEKKVWKAMALKDLLVSFIIKNHRQVYGVEYKNACAEVALDNYLTLAKGHQLRRREIEIELKKGKVADFEKLIQKINDICQLPVAKISKVAGAEKWITQKLG